MLINFKSDGGIAFFPGLNKAKVIDTNALSPEDALKAKELVQKCKFFSLSSLPKSNKGADYKIYTISVEEGSLKNSITVADPINNENLAELISFLNNISMTKH